MNRYKFLIVEDEFVVAENLKSDLESMGYSVVDMVSSGEEVLISARCKSPDMALMDIKLNGEMDGVTAAVQLRRELGIPVLFLTAYTDDALLERAKLAEPLGYLVKPYERKSLHAAIEVAVEKARMERLLKESESRFRAMFENASLAYMALDQANRILDHNPQFCDLLGYRHEELAGKKFEEFWSPETRRLHSDRFSNLMEYDELDVELELLRKVNESITVIFEGRSQLDKDGRFCRMHCMLHNITARKRVEKERLQQLQRHQQVQRAESLNRMAGAVAHNFNNMMFVVIGNLEMAVADLPKGVRCADNISNALQAAQRASEMSSFMLTYLGQGPKKMARLDLSETCRRMVPEIRDILPDDIRLLIDFPCPGPLINADAGQLQRVFFQLVTNAREAIGESGGEIRVAVQTLAVQDIALAPISPPDWKPTVASYATFEVSDTGVGIQAEDIDKVMDPFFSTKFTGRGLGLAMVSGIARAHQGAVTVLSQAGAGSVFQVLFPISGEGQMEP